MTDPALPLYRIYPNVHLGEECSVGDFAVVGIPPAGRASGELVTRLGPRALIRTHAVIYAGNQIGADFAAGHGALLREFNLVGDQVSVGSHAIIEHHVQIGRGVRIHSNAFVPEYSILEEEAWVGPCAVLTNARYPASPGAKHHLEGVRILKRAKIGAGATLLPGVTIGENALVGAGSVVTRDVPPGMVAAGNPARILKPVEELVCPWDLLERPYPRESGPR